MATEKLEKLLT